MVSPHFEPSDWILAASEASRLAVMCEDGITKGRLPIALLRTPEGGINARSLAKEIPLDPNSYTYVISQLLKEYSLINEVPHLVRMYAENGSFWFDTIRIEHS